MSLSAGTTLGRYEIRSQIGVGGMGEVYLAEDTKLRRKVALKVLSADLTQNEDRLRRFEQKALFDLAPVRAVVSRGIGYTATADGQRFLFVSEAEETPTLQYTVVVNWTAELKK